MHFSRFSLLTLLSSTLLLNAGNTIAATQDEATGNFGVTQESVRQSAPEVLSPTQFSPAAQAPSQVGEAANNPSADGTRGISPELGRETRPTTTAPASAQDNREASSGANCFRGAVSWYGPGFVGRRTANGERFNPGALTAAHPSWPFGTLVRVTHPGNGQQVEVRINDRGPFHGDRILDLSREAAARIGLLAQGSATLLMEKVGEIGAGCRSGDEANAPFARRDAGPAKVTNQRSGLARHGAVARHLARAALQNGRTGRHVTPCRQNCVKPRASAPARARTVRSSVRR